MAVNTIYNPDVLIIQTDKNIFESNSLIDFEVFDKKDGMWNKDGANAVWKLL